VDPFYLSLNLENIFHDPTKAGWGSQFGGLPAVSQTRFLFTNGSVVMSTSQTIDSVTGPAASLSDVIIGSGVTAIEAGAFLDCTALTGVKISTSVNLIGNQAFQGCSQLSGITIPEGVTSIGNRAFKSCTGLTTVHLPESLLTLGDSAFQGCTLLTGITLPSGLQELAPYLFSGCSSLGSMAIPDGVTAIRDHAFMDCVNLSTVSVPGTVTVIGWEAFLGCTSLTQFEIPAGVTGLVGNAFSGCSSLAEITVDAANLRYSSIDGVLFNRAKSLLKKFPEAKAGRYLVPASVTHLEAGAFHAASGLTQLTFLGDAPDPGTDVFGGTGSLTTVFYNSSRSGWGSTLGGLTAVAAPLPRVLQSGLGTGAKGREFSLTFSSVEGFSYSVQTSGDLQTWQNSRSFTGTGGPIGYSESSEPGQAMPDRRYYRVVQN
jgi:hypothetical protein